MEKDNSLVEDNYLNLPRLRQFYSKLNDKITEINSGLDTRVTALEDAGGASGGGSGITQTIGLTFIAGTDGTTQTDLVNWIKNNNALAFRISVPAGQNMSFNLEEFGDDIVSVGGGGTINIAGIAKNMHFVNITVTSGSKTKAVGCIFVNCTVDYKIELNECCICGCTLNGGSANSNPLLIKESTIEQSKGQYIKFYNSYILADNVYHVFNNSKIYQSVIDIRADVNWNSSDIYDCTILSSSEKTLRIKSINGNLGIVEAAIIATNECLNLIANFEKGLTSASSVNASLQLKGGNISGRCVRCSFIGCTLEDVLALHSNILSSVICNLRTGSGDVSASNCVILGTNATNILTSNTNCLVAGQ